ncbi:DNA-binding response regulator [Amylibacter marinus]|uniref:DNA-binding response regulator n=1 Tax=Amylibacter marinus TaxID=1475483 RepID=A0ABQ5VV77_9RHOB|nr:response regulator transcription factor [Amylibacter marinus]GLQ35330.1 DNA-binding response regulator [Amylibacter marinus]
MDKKLISIVEDSADIRQLLCEELNDAGYQTRSYGRATGFERDLSIHKPDVCIIDLGLPDKDGLALVNRLSVEDGIATIIISGRSRVQDKIVGLELGADDYITKPFEAAEVVARVRALLRRNQHPPSSPSKSVIRFSGWTADFDQHKLTNPDGEVFGLSAAEMQLLHLFLSSPNRLISREHMADQLGVSVADSFERAMDVRVSRLRTKLHDDPQNPKMIKTIYGAGYIFIGEI